MEGMIGEIRMFGGNFAPRAWALCDGQLLPIAQNTALFSILGTTYGGDGRTTFALPEVRGRAVLGPRHGPGLSDYRLGEKGGSEERTMTVDTMPTHNHTYSVATSDKPPISGPGSVTSQLVVTPDPSSGLTAIAVRFSSSADTTMHQDTFALGNTGGGQPFANMMPYQTVNYVICLQGVFPSRS